MNKKDDFNIYHVTQLEAIAGKLIDSEVAFENKIRRWYSRTFSTALHDTFKLSWPYILQQYYEDQVEDGEHNAIFELVVHKYLPDFISLYEKENDDFAESLLEEQQLTLEKKEAKEKTKKKVEKKIEADAPKIKEYNMNFEDGGTGDL